jgi:hypothetical protein
MWMKNGFQKMGFQTHSVSHKALVNKEPKTWGMYSRVWVHMCLSDKPALLQIQLKVYYKSCVNTGLYTVPNNLNGGITAAGNTVILVF